MPKNPMEFVARSLSESHPEDAARTLEAMDASDAAKVVRRLPMRVAGRVLEQLSPAAAAAILPNLGEESSRRLLEAIPVRRAASILLHLDEGIRNQAIEGLPDTAARQLANLLQYPPSCAGGMMDTQVASVVVDATVREAIQSLRRTPRHMLWYLYVTDRAGKLVGVLNTRELLLAEPRQAVEPLMRGNVLAVPASASREEVAEILRAHRYVALPVVDTEGRLLGVLKHDEVLQTLREEAFVDLQKMVGAGAEEHALSPVSLVVRKRLPWLYVNLATAFLAAAVVGLFESTIAQVTALAVLLPVVAGQGGNTGAQALAVVMRGIALREIAPGAERRVLQKELFGAFLNGTVVAVGTGLAVWAWDGRGALAAVIFFAMIVNMAAAGLFGAAIPMFLAARGQDPAQSSSIFLTTVTDCVGFAAFLGFAAAFMPFIVD